MIYIMNKNWLSMHNLSCLFFIKCTPGNVCKIIYNLHLWKWINNGTGWYDDTLISSVLFQIPICFLFHNTEVFCLD